MIEERYCSYEVATLLKEKGFDVGCYGRYSIRSKEFHFDATRKCENHGLFIIAAPTHQMACDWLGDIHDLHIIVYPYKRGNSKGWCCYVYKTYNLLGQERYVNETCNSCYEAIEEALKYSLENLV